MGCTLGVDSSSVRTIPNRGHFFWQDSYRLKKKDLTGNLMVQRKGPFTFRIIWFFLCDRGHSNFVSLGCLRRESFQWFSSGGCLPPPHSTFGSLRRLRSPPQLNQRNDRATPTISLHENRMPLITKDFYIPRSFRSASIVDIQSNGMNFRAGLFLARFILLGKK